MNGSRILPGSAAILALVCALSFGQTADDDWVIERPPTDDGRSTEPDDQDWVGRDSTRRPTEAQVTVARLQALGSSLAAKEAALRLMNRLLDEGRLTAFDGESMEVLAYLAQEGVRVGSHSFPSVRRRASEILGRIGGPFARAVLLDVMLVDPEPMVRSEAVYALGRMRAVPNRELTRGLTALIRDNIAGLQDDNLAYATLLAVELIHKDTAGITDPVLFQAIFDMAEAGFVPEVRRKAFEILNLLRGRD